LSEVRNFFRICPSCGRRFHIKLVNKKLEKETKVATERRERTTPGFLLGSRYAPVLPTLLEVDVPVTVDVEDFEFHYKCKHLWT
jgi:hypothetical protein